MLRSGEGVTQVLKKLSQECTHDTSFWDFWSTVHFDLCSIHQLYSAVLIHCLLTISYELTSIYPLHIGHTSASPLKTHGWRFEAGAIDCIPVARELLTSSDWSQKRSHTLTMLWTWPFSWNWFKFVKSSMLINSSWWHGGPPPCDRHHGPRLRCRADATARRLGPEHIFALQALHRRVSQSLQRDQHISKHVLLSQELYCLVARDLHPEMPQSHKVRAVDCSRQQDLQQASKSINEVIIAYSNCSNEIKTIRIPEF